MSEISISALKPGNVFNQNMNTAASGEADRIYDLYEEALKALRETEIISKDSEHIENAKKELNDVFTEACEENWNDEGAKAVSYDTYQKACEFINYLPKILPEAEISADPDGEISIEWYGKGNRVFSVSINDMGKLSFAALYGKKFLHGVDFFNCEVPDSLMINIKIALGL